MKRFAYAKTKMQISFGVTAKLFNAFVFATWIVQSLYFLNPKFQASSYLLWLHSLVCVGPCLKPRRLVFSRQGSYFSAEELEVAESSLGHNIAKWLKCCFHLCNEIYSWSTVCWDNVIRYGSEESVLSDRYVSHLFY